METSQKEIIVSPQQSGFLAPVISLQDALEAFQAKKVLIEKIFKKTVDFGEIPGSSKPSLLKPGAEKATSFFGLHPVIVDASVVEDWTGKDHGGEPFFYYRRTCNLYRQGILVASVDGSCNSWEKKYRYRSAERVCPKCGKETIIKGREEYGGGWLCYIKKGGCGAKFTETDQSITGQQVGQVLNPDYADIVNTVLKMADKRALIAATLIATGLSEYFTQDIEDYTNTAVCVDPTTGEILDGEVTEIKPTPPVRASTPSRPYSPETVREAITQKVATKGNVTATEKQVQLLAAQMETCFAGEADSTAKRHTVLKYLTGKVSLKDATGAEIIVLLDWIKPTQDDGGAYTPNPMSVKEAHAILVQAYKDAGQLPMIDDQPEQEG